MSTNVQKAFSGFAAGVMIAASFWSLLSPAIEMAENLNMIPWLIVFIGFYKLLCLRRENQMRKIAIMDVGSNNARLILVYIYDNGSYRIADQLKEPVRLISDMGHDNIIKPRN